MRSKPALTSLAALAGAFAAPWAAAQDASRASEFEDAAMFVEQNATDGDTEIVITAVPGDKGLTRFSVRSPHGERVFKVSAPRQLMGLREFLFETPEPAGEQILAFYPEGEYTFLGVADDGERFRGTAELSHDLPPPTVILFPAPGQEVPADSLTVQWSQVPDIEQFIFEFENESADPEQALLLNLPPDVTSFEVPQALLVAGADLQVGVATVAKNGNIVFVEVEFSTVD